VRCKKCDYDNDDGASMCVGCGAYLSAADLGDTGPPVSEYAASALLLALVSPLLAGMSALVALPLGVVALVQIRRSRGALRGTGRAVAAIIISVIVIAATLAVAVQLEALPVPWACEDCQPPETGMLPMTPDTLARPCGEVPSHALPRMRC